MGRDSARVVFCNTTAVTRVLHALHRHGWGQACARAPETIDCIRAPSGIERSGAASIAKTNAALGITKCFLPATAQQVPHLAGAAVPHPAVEAVQARHAALRSVGFAGVEEPTEE